MKWNEMVDTENYGITQRLCRRPTCLRWSESRRGLTSESSTRPAPAAELRSTPDTSSSAREPPCNRLKTNQKLKIQNDEYALPNFSLLRKSESSHTPQVRCKNREIRNRGKEGCVTCGRDRTCPSCMAKTECVLRPFLFRSQIESWEMDRKKREST